MNGHDKTVAAADRERDDLVLETPDPPAGTCWADVEDFRARELLKANGVALTQDALAAALTSPIGVLQAAAARTLGSLGDRAAIAALRPLAQAPDDLSQVEAAYALVRLGQDDYRGILVARLEDPVRACLGPMVAAGGLARLGDPTGYPVIARCFDEDNLVVRLVASKQLLFFVRFHGTRTVDGQAIDAWGMFEHALRDPHPDVQWSALVQLRELPTPEARRLLDAYGAHAGDAPMAGVAGQMPGPMS